MNNHITLASKSECTGCAACYNICNQNAITMKEDIEGFLFPRINSEKCIYCHMCEKTCPAFKINGIKKEGTAYAIQLKDSITLYNSASGGAFSLFAKNILDKNGVIYSVNCDNQEVSFERITKWEDLQRVRKSKYVSSNVNDSYRQVKKDVQNDLYVLFVGLPCQTVGLFSYLGKDYKKLFTVDLICHGVPSQKIYKEYISFIERQVGRNLNRVYFRGKKHGWGQWDIIYQDLSGWEEQRLFFNDPYCKLYLTNQIMRLSCYNCKFRNILQKRTDATIGDCWGYENLSLNNNFNFDKKAGISICFCHTEKAVNLLEDNSSIAEVQQVDFWRAVTNNWGALGEIISIPDSRAKIYSDLDNLGFDEVAKKYDKQIVAEDKSSRLRKTIRNLRIMRGYMKRRRKRQFKELVQYVKTTSENGGLEGKEGK